MTLFLMIITLLTSVVAIALSIYALRSTREQNRACESLTSEIRNLTVSQQRLAKSVQSKEKAGNVVQLPENNSASQTQKRELTNVKNTKQDVMFLNSQGMSVDRIARDLDLPRGEVELILGLNKFKANR